MCGGGVRLGTCNMYMLGCKTFDAYHPAHRCFASPRRARRMEEVKTEAGAPSDELAALRDSELRMQRRLTEQRRRESKVVLRAAVCESEKRKLSETVSGLQRAAQPAQKQVLPPPTCSYWRCPTRGRAGLRGFTCGAWSGERHEAPIGTQPPLRLHGSRLHLA